MCYRIAFFLSFMILSISISIVFASSKKDALKLFETGRMFYEKGNYKKARFFLEKAIEIVPHDGKLKIRKDRTTYKKECKVIPVGRIFKTICKKFPKKEVYFETFDYYPNKLLAEIIAQTAPPYLEIEKVELTDENGDRIFEAGEKVFLFVRISNRGKGSSPENTKLKISSPVFGEKVIHLGKILSNSDIEKNIMFTVPIKVKTQKQILSLEVLAGEYSPEPVKIVFYTKAPLPPRFKIAYRIDDDNIGESVGNGNGIIEPRETIELYITVQNIGKGFAKGVEVVLSSSEVRVLKGVAKIGNLPPGGQASGKLLFFVPAYYSNDTIKFSLEVHEALGLWTARHTLAFSVKKRGSRLIELAGVPPVSPVEEDVSFSSILENMSSSISCVQKYPNRYFLAVGEIHYTDLPSLEFVKNDLKLMKKIATCYMGVPEKNVAIYKDLTYAKFKRVVRSFAQKVSQKDATVIFYYSGHGVMHTSGEFYFLPTDADITTEENMEDSSIPISFLEQILGRIGKERVVIMDACRIKVAWKPAFLIPKGPKEDNMAFIFSTQKGKISYGTSKGASAFTLALWKLVQAGIKNLDINGSGYIELSEIKQPLIQWMKKINAEQMPDIIGSENVDLFPVK